MDIKTPKVQINTGIEMKIRKFQYVMKRIYDKFYQDQGFYLLHDINEPDFAKIRYFSLLLSPFQIEYLTKINDWKKYFVKGSKVLILDDPAYSQKWKELVNDYPVDEEKLLSDVAPPDININALQKAYTEFNSIFGIKTKFEIQISFSNIGVGGSMQYSENNIYFYARHDITEMDLFSMYARLMVYKNLTGMTWKEYQAISMYLAKYLDITKSLSGHKLYQTKKRTLVEVPTLRAKSNQLFSNIGFPPEQMIRYTESDIYISNRPAAAMSQSQYKIMKHFIDSKMKIATPYEIGDIIWGKESEEFSLQAVNKQIARLRTTLSNSGLKKEVIHTVRGKGYYFCE